MEFLNMSNRELERHAILVKVKSKALTQLKAAELLNLSTRQVRNLLKRFEILGPQGLVSYKRGKTSNRQTHPEIKSFVLKLINDRYSDFGPTLITENLKERYGITLSRETLRKWMSVAHFWVPHQRKKNYHPLRKRKDFFGEMIQADGSHHDWFEIGHFCNLFVFIDDATGKITSAQFSKRESLEGYYEVLRQHLIKYGRPFSLYTDRFSVFESSKKKENLTQFQRTLKELDIKWIGANSPQAKGRVERCNRTLQDRLIKEMRLRGIKTLEEGNIFLEDYIKTYNDKFSKKPMGLSDLHRPLEQGTDLDRTLSKYEERTLTKDLTFQFHNNHYQIYEQTKELSKGSIVEVRLDKGKNVRIYKGKIEFKIRRLNEVLEPCKIIKLSWTAPNRHPQSYDHPWKTYSYNKSLNEKKRNQWYNEVGTF